MVTATEILGAGILVVDDQPANVLLLEEMLHGAGYTRVTSTMDSRDVCALHREHRYDLILLDLQMPGLDGFEVMEGLKEIEKDDYLPVLVITAQPGHKLRALNAGAKDFIRKPFDLTEVLTRVRNMLEVRLLHVELRACNAALAVTVQDVEASRELVRQQRDEVRRLYDQVVIEQKLSDRLRLHMPPDVISVRPDDEIRPLVHGYLARRRDDVLSLRTALAASDFVAVRSVGRTITETGRGYGFEGLTEIGSALERAAHHEDRDAIHTRIDHLEEYLRRVRVVEGTPEACRPRPISSTLAS